MHPRLRILRRPRLRRISRGRSRLVPRRHSRHRRLLDDRISRISWRTEALTALVCHVIGGQYPERGWIV